MARPSSPTSVRPSPLRPPAPDDLAEQLRRTDIRLRVPARAESIGVVRQALTAAAQALRLPNATVEDLRLAVTEACTNVVRHAYQDGEGTIDVTMRPDGDTLRVIVADRGRGISPSADQEGPGLGLSLIAALSDDLEISHAPGDGSELCMTFSRSARAARDEAR